MEIIREILNSVPIVVGIALVALGLDAEPRGRRVSIITGVVLIVLGALVR